MATEMTEIVRFRRELAEATRKFGQAIGISTDWLNLPDEPAEPLPEKIHTSRRKLRYPRVSSIVEKWLKANGYDGLVAPDGKCACEVGEIHLGWCEGKFETCQPAHRASSGVLSARR